MATEFVDAEQKKDCALVVLVDLLKRLYLLVFNLRISATTCGLLFVYIESGRYKPG